MMFDDCVVDMTDCPVCQDTLASDLTAISPCGHVFHGAWYALIALTYIPRIACICVLTLLLNNNNSIMEWMKSGVNRPCPICKEPIRNLIAVKYEVKSKIDIMLQRAANSGAAPSAAILRMRVQALTEKMIDEQAGLQTARQHITAVRDALVKDTAQGESQREELLSAQTSFASLESSLAPLLKQVMLLAVVCIDIDILSSHRVMVNR
jgi:hypothetical protein